jgi:integrase
MSIYKRGGVYWYKFQYKGRLIRESSKQGSNKVARTMEAAHKTSLAKGEVGLREQKVIPTLAEFCDKRVEPWARATFEFTCLNNWYWFRAGIRRLLAFKSLSNLVLAEITNEKASEFATYELTRSQNNGKQHKHGLAISSVNSSPRVLRRVLHLAVEWGVLEVAPKISKLPGELRRERVITLEEESNYLAVAPGPLRSIVTVLANTEMRPDECYRVRWEDINWTNGRHGTVFVRHGKTPAARRVLPLTPLVRGILELRWEGGGKPDEGWIWPAPTQSSHVEHSSLKKQHARTFRTMDAEAKKHKTRLTTPWVLYAWRHTFVTRLGESGCDTWTLARIAGHSSVEISSRYVHPSEDAVFAPVSRLGGHNSGHSPEIAKILSRSERPEVVEAQEEIWCARRDSNSRPIAPEAIALSS